MTHKCKSGQHAWFFKEDAEKCCNGFRRMLVFDDPKACDIVVNGHLARRCVLWLQVGAGMMDFGNKGPVRFFRYC